MKRETKTKTKTKGKTPITYYGGKQNMLKHILPLIPKHTLYTEAFAGGAALFFAKERSEVEVINDLNGELVNFYQTIVNKFEQLKQRVDTMLHSRNQHAHAWYIYNNSNWFTEIERAWALFILSKLGFAGQLSSAFGFDKSKCLMPKKLFYAKDAFNLGLKERLECVTIENDNALKVIKRFDTEYAFHFIDPPYIGSNMGHYSGMFNNQSLQELLELCANLKGKFMLTMYPNDAIAAFAKKHKWKIHRIERQVTAAKKIDTRRKQEEWIVCNYCKKSS